MKSLYYTIIVSLLLIIYNNNSYSIQPPDNITKVVRLDLYKSQGFIDIMDGDSVYNYKDDIWYTIKVERPQSVYHLYQDTVFLSKCVSQDIYVVETSNNRTYLK